MWAWENLVAAWKKVKANRGSAGADEETVAVFERQWERNLRELQRVLREGKYQVSPVLRVYIPKASGGKRPLGIPTLRDRIVQQAVRLVIEPLLERKFSPASFGFRPGRSPHDAHRAVVIYRKQGYRWVVDADIESFFDRVDHGLLLSWVAEEVKDRAIFRLIRAWLKCGVMEEMRVRKLITGTPQGGVISPLLANLYLHRFDQAMEARGYKLVRYCDDFVILAKRRDKAQRAFRYAGEVLARLRLSLNLQKTQVTTFEEGFEFLGFLYKGNWKIPREKAARAFKEKIKHLTRRQQPVSREDLIRRVNEVVRGWGHFFKYGNSWRVFEKLDRYTRMRVRAFLDKKKATYFANYRYPNYLLKRWGLVSLLDLYPAGSYSLLRGQ
ncbi:MAG: group II intron reverse transcriptase/maturase [Candidatus Binatia bacterium]